MSIEIRLVGGPADGRTYAVSDASPPPLYFVALPWSVVDLVSAPLEPSYLQKAEYEPQFENDLFSVAEDGAYLYRHRAAPLTPEQRAALAEGRRAARADEERRAAEMDENWRKIREERPDFPEDWRDLF